MTGPSERDELQERTKEAHRRSHQLEQDANALHDRLLETAESVRQSYERTAETMEDLAATGPAAQLPRRREAAARLRKHADDEARQIAELTARDSERANQGHPEATEPATRVDD